MAGHAGKIDLLTALCAGGEGDLGRGGLGSGGGLCDSLGEDGVRLQGKNPQAVRDRLRMFFNPLQGVCYNPAKKSLNFPFLLLFKESPEGSGLAAFFGAPLGECPCAPCAPTPFTEGAGAAFCKARNASPYRSP